MTEPSGQAPSIALKTLIPCPKSRALLARWLREAWQAFATGAGGWIDNSFLFYIVRQQSEVKMAT